MPIKDFRLVSILPHGVGGPEAGAISLMYAMLLHEFQQDFYQIMINQIGEGNDPDEIILKGPGSKIHINIRYPAYNDFELRSSRERNLIRLDVIHKALNRISDRHQKLDKSMLEAIKSKILEHDFSFQFPLKKFVNAKNKEIVGKLLVEPQMDEFVYYISVEQNGKETQASNLPWHH